MKFLGIGEIVLINTSEIIRVVRFALSKIDKRLIDHGDRVAYIAAKICSECADKSDFDISKLFVLSVLHDIGAYKTNEIDDMVKFETDSVFEHSLYGYLFLKNTKHLSEYAEAVLYHHTDFSSPKLKDCAQKNYAQLIYLSDRLDILINASNSDLGEIQKHSGSKFNPEYVEAFFRAENKYHISENIKTGSYKSFVAEFNETLDVSHEETLDYLSLLVYAIDFRSPYTVIHTADTTVISVEIGKLMGLSEKKLQALYLGAFLHDIGKIAIPNSILDKPGKLTPEEFEKIKTHIPEGEQILRGVVNDEICDIALRHHEKLDGSGYFHGYGKNELTLSQRIVTVSDIASALAQRRSYKEPFGKDKVIGILCEMVEKGQVCPKVVDTLCENYDFIFSKTELGHNTVKNLYDGLIREYEEQKRRLLL